MALWWHCSSKWRFNTINNMRQWSLRPISVIVLSLALLVILLVQVLPQVDLLDTAFQQGTAPIAVHFKATARPLLSMTPFGFSLFFACLRSSETDALCVPQIEPNTSAPNPPLRC